MTMTTVTFAEILEIRSSISSLADQSRSILCAEYFTKTVTFGITVSNSITEETGTDRLVLSYSS